MEFPTQTNRSDEDAWLLATLCALEPERSLRRIPGRETLLTRLSGFQGGARVVVKRFRGGAGREGWREWLQRRRPRSAGRREFENLRDLATVGLPVPEALRCVEDRDSSRLFGAGDRGRSAFVMECVEHFDDLRGVLANADAAARRRWTERLVAVVRRLHERGWIHRDLYLQHFLVPVADPEALVLIDVARARWSARPGRRWLVKDLAALRLSAPANVTRTEQLRFLKHWLEGQGQREILRWKWWARSIVAKARRLGAHRPKFDDPDERVGVEPERDLDVRVEVSATVEPRELTHG